MKILLPIILFFISQNLFSQNKKIDFDTNKIKEAVRLSNTSEVFIYDSLYIWSDKRSLSEIMDERSGYFVNDFGLGGRNVINFNGYSEKDIGIFRDGIQINDNLFGGFDIQNISVNEIDKIEEISNVSSFLYGINSTTKAINIITKDIFHPKPFSQLRYSQDRYNSLYADVFFTLPFSKKINWMVGATKHSIDGRYQNSEFDVWRGRTRLSFYLSPKFNLKLNFYYDKIKRGLNGGLVDNINEDSLISSSAVVRSPFDNEEVKNYYSDISLFFKLFKDQNSQTQIKLFSINSSRNFHGKQTNSVYKDTIVDDRYKTVRYGIDISQNFSFINNKNFQASILLGSNLYFDNFKDSIEKYLHIPNYSENYYTGYGKIDFTYGSLSLYPLFKYESIRKNGYFSYGLERKNGYFSYGIEGRYKLFQNKNFEIKLFGGLNSVNTKYITNFTGLLEFEDYYDSIRNYSEFGISFKFKDIYLKSYYYNNNTSYGLFKYSHNGINVTLNYLSKYFEFYNQLNYMNKEFYPRFFLKSDYSYHNFFFKNKLNLHLGFNLKFYDSKYNVGFDQRFYYSYLGISHYSYRYGFLLDFYIGARIGHANINITLANIFNNFYYNAYLFPLDNRGGFLNSISRFTIVWDFIN